MNHIILIGFMGAGKTTLGRRLARALRLTFTDTDDRIVARVGMSVTAIFDQYGEEYFRDIESRTVEKLSALSGAVIATGGGCLLRAENTAALKRDGKLVFLRTTPETLIRRVEGNSERPLLKGVASEKINELYKTRQPVYEKAADIIVDTDGLSPDEIARIITERI